MDDAYDAMFAALNGLLGAVAALIAPIAPEVPMPRSRTWRLMADVMRVGAVAGVAGGPHLEIRSPDGAAQPQSLIVQRWNADVVVRDLIKKCGGQPRRIARAIAVLRAATAWCEARRAGRERAAAEVVRQQARWADIVAAEAAMVRIAR